MVILRDTMNRDSKDMFSDLDENGDQDSRSCPEPRKQSAQSVVCHTILSPLSNTPESVEDDNEPRTKHSSSEMTASPIGSCSISHIPDKIINSTLVEYQNLESNAAYGDSVPHESGNDESNLPPVEPFAIKSESFLLEFPRDHESSTQSALQLSTLLLSNSQDDNLDCGRSPFVVTKLPPKATPAKTASSMSSKAKTTGNLRRGKWTTEEEAYVARVIQDFNSGYLDAPAGTTLRTYLSEKLKCDPMRITKKFTGEACIGKRVFHPSVRTPSTVAAIDKAQVR
jgi:hypothetical protein